MPPVRRPRAARSTASAEQKRLLAALKTERAKLKKVEEKQGLLLVTLAKTVQEFTNAETVRSNVVKNQEKLYESIIKTLRP